MHDVFIATDFSTYFLKLETQLTNLARDQGPVVQRNVVVTYLALVYLGVKSFS
jgi:hypothetical protein